MESKDIPHVEGWTGEIDKHNGKEVVIYSACAPRMMCVDTIEIIDDKTINVICKHVENENQIEELSFAVPEGWQYIGEHSIACGAISLTVEKRYLPEAFEEEHF